MTPAPSLVIRGHRVATRGGLHPAAIHIAGGRITGVSDFDDVAAGVERELAEGATVKEAVRRLDQDIQPIDDLRSTAEYRRDVVGNLVRQFWASTA